MATAGILPITEAYGSQPLPGYFPGATVAGFTPNQQASWGSQLAGAQNVQNQANYMTGGYNQMLGGIGSAVNAPMMGAPPQVGSGMIGPAPQVGSGMIGGAPQVGSSMIGSADPLQWDQMGQAQQLGYQSVDPNAYSNAQAGQSAAGMSTAGPGMNYFDNPYMHQTVQDTAGALTQNYQRNVLPGMQAGNVAAGGMGSSRAGVAEGLATGDLNRQVGDMANQMYTGMYESGKGHFLDERGQNLQSSMGNAANQTQSSIANAGFQTDTSKFNSQNALNAALANQQAGMRTGEFNVGQDYQRQLANQAAGMQAGQFDIGQDFSRQQANQGTGLAASQANAGNWLTGAQANQGAQLAASGQNAGNWLTGAQANQGAQLSASGQNAGNWLTGQQSNQNAALQSQMANAGNTLGAYGMAGQMADIYGQGQGAVGQAQAGIGQEQQAMNQSLINSDVDRWNFSQTAPGDRMSELTSLITGSGGGSFNESESSGSSGKF